MSGKYVPFGDMPGAVGRREFDPSKRFRGSPSFNKELEKLGLTVKDLLSKSPEDMADIKVTLDWLEQNPDATPEDAARRFRDKALVNTSIADAFEKAARDGISMPECLQEVKNKLLKKNLQ